MYTEKSTDPLFALQDPLIYKSRIQFDRLAILIICKQEQNKKKEKKRKGTPKNSGQTRRDTKCRAGKVTYVVHLVKQGKLHHSSFTCYRCKILVSHNQNECFQFLKNKKCFWSLVIFSVKFQPEQVMNASHDQFQKGNLSNSLSDDPISHLIYHFSQLCSIQTLILQIQMYTIHFSLPP